MIIKRLIIRLVYGLVFALPLMLISYAAAQASEPVETDVNQPFQQVSCPACHESFQKEWEQGAHGQSTTDPTFQTAYQAQGQPAECLTCHVTGYDPVTGTWASDGITCQACHDTENANHPAEPMAADRSGQLCGECHNETYFEWQASAHREAGLDCVGCHDPHGTSLKAGDPSTQCASCHRTRASNYAHTAHSEQGLQCVDCHMSELPDPQEGHGRLDHSFDVRLSTCNECHAYQMHDPSEVHAGSGDLPSPESVESPDAMAAVESLSVISEPIPVSPVGFATLAGLFGLGAGVILAPWINGRKRK